MRYGKKHLQNILNILSNDLAPTQQELADIVKFKDWLEARKDDSFDASLSLHFIKLYIKKHEAGNG